MSKNSRLFGKDWEPRLGQKVVALIDSDSWKKDDIFEVLGLRKICKHTEIDIGIKSPLDGVIECDFCFHQSDVQKGGIWWASTKCFAPLQSFPSAIQEILEKYPIPEHSEVDVIKVEEVMSN